MKLQLGFQKHFSMVAVIHRSIDLISGKKGRNKVQKQHEIAFRKTPARAGFITHTSCFRRRTAFNESNLISYFETVQNSAK